MIGRRIQRVRIGPPDSFRLLEAGECAPLTTYPPTVIKELVTSSIASEVPTDMFRAARTRLVDRIYGEVRANGDPNQRKFLDEYVLSETQAEDVAAQLAGEVVDILDDGYQSQLRMAAIIAKLRLAPAVVTSFRLSGDNHQPDGLSVEAERTLEMMAAYRDFYDFANAMGVYDECLYATLTVFGRSMNERGNGRGHNRQLATGLVAGRHVNRTVVGGIDPNEPEGVSMPFNASTGGIENPDVSVDDSFASYAKSVLQAAGVPEERLGVRFRDVPAVGLS